MKKTITIALVLITLVCSIVASPQIALQSAKYGFNIWWNCIFPILLPMYMLLILCNALGLFHSISFVIIRLFRLHSITPNELSPFVYRWFSGSTTFSQLSSQLPKLESTKVPSRTLATLLALSYNANPIFVVVVIFTSYVSLSFIGTYMITVLLIATMLSAMLIQLFASKQHLTSTKPTNAIHALEEGRKADGRSIGKLLGEGIYESVQQLFFIGGIMLFGSVLSGYFQTLLPLTSLFQFTYVLEYHLGAYALLNSTLSLKSVIVFITILLSVGGIIQLIFIYGLYKQQQLPFFTFIKIRFLHVMISIILVLFSYPLVNKLLTYSSTQFTISHVFKPWTPATDMPIHLFVSSMFICASLLLFIIVLNLLGQRYIVYTKK